MKTLNKLILIASIAALVSCGGADERKSAYLEKAMQSMQAGNYDKARIELKNVLQIDPKDARAYFALGEVYEAKQDFRKAFGNYNKAAELDPQNTEYLAKIGRFYLVLANDADKAKEQLQKIEAIDTNDPNGLLLKAGILLKNGDLDEAYNIVSKLFSEDSSSEEVGSFLAVLYTKKDQPDEAVRVLEKTLESNRANAEIKTKLAAAYILAGKRAKAEELLKDIVKQEPEVFNHYLNLARFYQHDNRIADAENVLRDAIEKDENDFKRKISLVGLVKEKKGVSEAIKILDEYVSLGQEAGKLLLVKADLLKGEGNVDDAADIYKKVIKDYSDEEVGVRARIALAGIYAEQNDLSSAKQVVNEAMEVSPNDSDLNTINAKLSIIDKDYEQAIISLRTVIKENPEQLDAYMLLAESHKSLGNNEQAKDVMQRAYDNNRGNIASMKKLASYYARTGSSDMAERAVDSALELSPSDYDLLSLKSALLNADKKFDEAEQMAHQLIKVYPAKPGGYLQAASSLSARKRYDDAEKILREGIEKTRDVNVSKSLGTLLLFKGDSKSAISTLVPLAQEDNDENLILLISKAYLADKQENKALEILRSAFDDHPAWDRIALAIASIEGKEGIAEAISFLEIALKKNPGSLRVRAALAGLYTQNNDVESAITQYEEILKLKSDNLVATNNLAALLADNRTDKVSMMRAMELSDKLKQVNNPLLNDTVGWVYYRNGMYKKAVEMLKKVVETNPDVPVYNYHLGMAYYQAGDKENAKKYLEKAALSDKDFAGKDEAVSTLKLL